MSNPMDNIAEDGLKMSYDPNTIEHLGVRMYSTLPPVLAELIANSYDADADEVSIDLQDNWTEKAIVITDDGNGMSFEDINTKFLRIGRNRRDQEGDVLTKKGRKVIGKKGLWKLSFFWISHEVEITTVKDGLRNSFVMTWEEILSAWKANTQEDYAPTIKEKNVTCEYVNGTRLVLKKIQRESAFEVEGLMDSISKMFIVDEDFKIAVQFNSGEKVYITDERKYEWLDAEITWRVPEDLGDFRSDFPHFSEIKGYLIAGKSPIPPKTNMRGITLFSRKKLVNLPEYFSDSTSSHFFSYLTGWLSVDFIDELGLDVIGTNRQTLNWDHQEMQTLREALRKMINWLERDWRRKRTEIRNTEVTKKTGINIEEWFSHVPEKLKSELDPIISALLKDSEMPEETMSASVKRLHNIVKPYPYFHWRNLNSEVREVAVTYYKNEDYYSAVTEATKRYVKRVKEKTGSLIVEEQDMLSFVFRESAPLLSITKRFKKADGTDFSKKTIIWMEKWHRDFVIGAWTANRCPVAHEEIVELRSSWLFTERHCLDALSLLSHLFDRLDSAEAP
jgi:uncharacterized protein (TIGR02391 family)